MPIPKMKLLGAQVPKVSLLPLSPVKPASSRLLRSHSQNTHVLQFTRGDGGLERYLSLRPLEEVRL